MSLFIGGFLLAAAIGILAKAAGIPFWEGTLVALLTVAGVAFIAWGRRS